MLEGFTTAADVQQKYNIWDGYVPPGTMLTAKHLFNHRNAHLFRELAYRTSVAVATGQKAPGQVSAHGPLLGNVTINRGSVLYMARLDSRGFTKAQLAAAIPSGEPWPANLFFPPECLYVEDLSIAYVHQWALEAENPSLLVIECLEAFCDYAKPEHLTTKEHRQRLDKARERLREIAAELGIVVLIIFETVGDAEKSWRRDAAQ